MKILMLTTCSSLMDGINRHILMIASALNGKPSCEVAVCIVFPGGELADALAEKGVRTFSLGASHGHDFRIFSAFRKVMKSYNPDIVHVHVVALFEKMMLSTLYRSGKFVLTVHGISDEVRHETFRMKADKWLDRIFHIPYGATCFISEGVRSHYSPGSVQEGVFTIYNPILFPNVTCRDYRLHKLIGVDNGTPIVGTSCRLARVKAPELFIDVMCRVLKQHPKVHAVIFGDGDEGLVHRLRDMVSSNGFCGRFHFLGYRSDAPVLVADFDCFVMTSLSEGLPTAILEAMSHKVPFAMMEGKGGLKDIAMLDKAEGPIGIVAKWGDAEGMANGVLHILRDSAFANALAEKAFEVGKKHFNVQMVTDRLLEVYHSLTI